MQGGQYRGAYRGVPIEGVPILPILPSMVK